MGQAGLVPLAMNDLELHQERQMVRGDRASGVRTVSTRSTRIERLTKTWSIRSIGRREGKVALGFGSCASACASQRWAVRRR